MTVPVIYSRQRILVNTDPQRRCYNGCHFSSELRWSDWVRLETTTPEKAARRLTFWEELNDYAVKERGEEAKREFKIIEEGASPHLKPEGA